MTKREAYLLAGPTASGKSAAAAILARARGAAILSADSMLVYRGMDLGTAKPSREEREEFCMGGVDIVTPAEHFSSGAWLRAAAEWLAALPADRPVVVVGGTGLYFSALLRGLDREWTFPPPEYPVLQMPRARLHERIESRLDAMFMDGLAAEVAELRRDRIQGVHRRASRRVRAGEDTCAHAPAREAAGHLVPPPVHSDLRSRGRHRRGHCRGC